MSEILWPWGSASTLALTATGDQALTIVDNFTIIDGVTTQATGNRVLILTISDKVKTGAMILVKSKTAGTQTLAFTTGMLGATVTGEAGKTITRWFVYDGTAFTATNEKVD